MEQIEVVSLFNYAMKGKWEEVLEAYKENHGALEAKITKTEETVLHIAVYVSQTNFVTTLLDNITEDHKSSILKLQNSKGNTPLHLAAELGNVDICDDIAKRDGRLISIRNFEGETPLFLAALHGNRDAFFCLYGHQQRQDDYSLCRIKKGDTILHATISGEYFGLALQILRLYPDLVGFVNEDGLTPLHVLAMKSNCFQSCTRMVFFQRVVYRCLIVDELKEVDRVCYNRADKATHHYPKNYGTCMNVLFLLKKAFKISTIGKGRKAASDDLEKDSQKFCFRNEQKQEQQPQQQQAKKVEKRYRFPPNWEVIIRFLSLTMKMLLIFCGVGASWIKKIQQRKEKHMGAKQLMNNLIDLTPLYNKYGYDSGRKPDADHEHDIVEEENIKSGDIKKGMESSPILIAAKMGVTEMVEKILQKFPVAIQDVDSENKNVVLLAIENRQPRVYELLTKMDLKESAFRQVDIHGNSALHLAAACQKCLKPWRVPGAGLQMQWEYKWYKLVKDSMPPNFYERYNKKGQTAKHIFMMTHSHLVKEGRRWLTKTANSCSVVAALVASVAFTTSTTIPGGPNQNTGIPLLEGRAAFDIFALTSLVALCSSITALLLFISILSSRFQEKDFVIDLPWKFLVGLTSLSTAIASILISFCAAHFFIIEGQMKYAVYFIYAATCLPISFFALVQLPLYFDLTSAIFRHVPQRSYKEELKEHNNDSATSQSTQNTQSYMSWRDDKYCQVQGPEKRGCVSCKGKIPKFKKSKVSLSKNEDLHNRVKHMESLLANIMTFIQDQFYGEDDDDIIQVARQVPYASSTLDYPSSASPNSNEDEG